MKIESILLILVSCLFQTGCTSQNSPNAKVSSEPAEVKAFRVLTDADVVTGAEQIVKFLPEFKDKTIACVVNQTSTIGQTHLVDSLLSSGLDIKRIFAPEHGFRGEADAGELLADGKDVKTGIPIKSLYGASKKPSAKDLAGVDLLIYDIQDVGARFYTYLSTLHYVMEACAESDIKLFLLDRPNPNGFYVDGPVLKEEFKSFVGMHQIPIVHGMTFGEIAQMIVGEKLARCENLELEIIWCLGYDHNSTYVLPIKPSPNLPNHQSIMLYPSICLFEPTNYSIGRGTSAQFQLIGIPGGTQGDFNFTPRPMPGAMKPKNEGRLCRGEDLRTYDVSWFYENRKLDLSYLMKYLSGEKTAEITNSLFFDKLAGSSELRKMLTAGDSEEDIRMSWEPALSEFKDLRQQYLFYNE